jgi:hypothetical protein
MQTERPRAPLLNGILSALFIEAAAALAIGIAIIALRW